MYHRKNGAFTHLACRK